MAKGAFIGVPTIIPGNTPLGNKAVGDIVKLNVGGVAVDFIVVHQGNPNTSLYDASCDGTWLLMKNVYEKNKWHNSNSNSYKASTIHTYLNGTFWNLLDADIKAQIKTVKIPYVNGTGSSAVASGSSGLSAQIFLLSGYEVGWTQSTNKYFPIDGACLSYFSGTSATDSKRIAYLNGTATSWWLRSPGTNHTSAAWFVSTNGAYELLGCANPCGVRPALILPSNLGVEEDGTVLSTPAVSEGEIVEVAREVKQMFIGVDGVARKVKKAWVGVNGVARMFFGSSGMSLSDLPVGTLIRTNVNGAAKNFIVVHQGLPSSIYDSSCNGTWLLMKDIYEKRVWHSSKINNYKNSTIHSYLNSTFLGLLDNNIQSIVKQVKIPYVNGTGPATNLKVTSGANGLSAKIFLLSGTEVSFYFEDVLPAKEGAELSYFKGLADEGNASKRVAKYNGTATAWWLRSPTNYELDQEEVAAAVGTKGEYDAYSCTETTIGVRPAFILPSDALVNPTPNADGSYTLIA